MLPAGPRRTRPCPTGERARATEAVWHPVSPMADVATSRTGRRATLGRLRRRRDDRYASRLAWCEGQSADGRKCGRAPTRADRDACARAARSERPRGRPGQSAQPFDGRFPSLNGHYRRVFRSASSRWLSTYGVGQPEFVRSRHEIARFPVSRDTSCCPERPV
jgi:hypothetical protein